MSFINDIQALGNTITFQGIRKVAENHLPNSPAERDKLFNELLHGTKILDDEPHENMYLYSYGRMHEAKMKFALDSIPLFDKLFAEDIEIFDWGCGQGIATICLLDKLKALNILPSIRRITLVEPSSATIHRACSVIKCYPNIKDVEIRLVNKPFDELTKEDIRSLNCRKLHLFSNILDVTAFDLAVFTQLFQETQKGGNYIVCVGPMNGNYKRIDWFVEAIHPDYRYAKIDKPKGTWLIQTSRGLEPTNWTMVLRIVAGFVVDTEDISAIRQRIENAQRHQQMFAGFVTDALSDTLLSSEYAKKAEELLASLSMFDVRSNMPLEHDNNIDPILAVVSNIISRGMPTRASRLIEEKLVQSFGFSIQPIANPVEYHYNATERCKAQEFFKALHIIYPHFNLQNYNKGILESGFENDFIKCFLPENGKEYLTQLLEPQRPLSSIIDVSEKTRKQFGTDQRVDFAFELPYTTGEEDKKIGFVVEINGKPYHSSSISRIKDARRDTLIKNCDWNTYNLESIDDKKLSDQLENDKEYSSYLQIVKENYAKEISGEWKDVLQFALSPFAIARIEKVLVEALISGYLKLDAKKWNIAVIERDIPCAVLAVKEVKEIFEHLCQLRGSNEKFPEINLSVFSNESFCDSLLHDGHKVKISQRDSTDFDICIDCSMLLRDKVADMPISIKSDIYYVIRSSHYSKCARKIYCAENIEYQPLVEKTTRGEYINIPGREEILQYFLQNIFRKHAFRDGQLPILSHVLENKTTIGLLPTGGGKSLTYQLPSLLQPGVAIVVDPLVSLMENQYDGLINQRIDVTACINSTMDRKEKMFHLGRMETGQVQFMLLSPERFMMKEDFRDELTAMCKENNIYFSYGVIDEVHTVSEWGHDFRPAYLQLGRNMTRFMQTKSGKDIAIIGLTATASFDVLADVERELTLGNVLSLDSDATVKPDLPEREELTYRIEQVKADFSSLEDSQNPYILNTNSYGIRKIVVEAKRKRIKELMDQIPSDINEINKQSENSNTQISNYSGNAFYSPENEGVYNNAGIVFCPHREGLYGVHDKVTPWNVIQGNANFFRELNDKYVVGTYVGGDPPKLMKAFINNKQNIMVATKAFGMGIDKPNVRFTMNINHPSSIESYVQEAGRAGRDRKVAISYLLHEPTEYIQLSAEVISDMFGQTIPTFFTQLHLMDKYILYKDIKPAFQYMNVPDNVIDSYIRHLEKYKQSADVDIQLYFHNNSFKGVYKEKVILSELTYNKDNTLITGIYDAMKDLVQEEYAEVIIPWVNEYFKHSTSYNNLVLTEVQRVAAEQGWNAPATFDAYNQKSFEKLLIELSKMTKDNNWRTHHNDSCIESIKRAYYKKRDKDDTDKAIYRMCCIGLVDDVTIDYNNELYKVKVKKKEDFVYYDCLRAFFEKYYSAGQALIKTEEAKEHRGSRASDKCMGYLAEFVYSNLATKRRRAIDDMRDACILGAGEDGEKTFKDHIHLYFNSKYARDKFEIDGQNYSLKRDIRENKPVLDVVMKYINAMNIDPSGSEVNNLKHLYGAVLIILRAQTDDNAENVALFMLRSFCIACLGTNKNDNLIEQFKEGFGENGYLRLIKEDNTEDPVSMWSKLKEYDEIIKKKSKEDEQYIRDYIDSQNQQTATNVINRYYSDFTNKYTNTEN